MTERTRPNGAKSHDAKPSGGDSMAALAGLPSLMIELTMEMNRLGTEGLKFQLKTLDTAETVFRACAEQQRAATGLALQAAEWFRRWHEMAGATKSVTDWMGDAAGKWPQGMAAFGQPGSMMFPFAGMGASAAPEAVSTKRRAA